MSKKRDPRIISLDKSYIERERKFIPLVPVAIERKGEDEIAAYKSRKLLAIAHHVRECRDIFVTPDHPAIAPVIPETLKSRAFTAQDERTKPRERIYYVDAGLKIWAHGVEFRQEVNKSYGVKQTIKIDRDAADGSATLNREEIPARLTGPGIVLKAVMDEKQRNWLREHFAEKSLKPAFRMVSQRVRMPYYPEGDTNVMIELACDTILFGETIFGKCWQDPKLEIEIIKGPADEAACRAILEREERRLLDIFNLTAQSESNAEIGYAHLAPALATPAGRARFDRLKSREIWWNHAGRARWGLK